MRAIRIHLDFRRDHSKEGELYRSAYSVPPARIIGLCSIL